jgi:hypothetical protein
VSAHRIPAARPCPAQDRGALDIVDESDAVQYEAPWLARFDELLEGQECVRYQGPACHVPGAPAVTMGGEPERVELVGSTGTKEPDLPVRGRSWRSSQARGDQAVFTVAMQHATA